MKKYIMTVLMFVCLLGCGTPEPEIKDMPQELSRKDLIVHRFGMNNCRPCRDMKDTFWEKPEIRQILRDYKTVKTYNVSDKNDHYVAKRYGLNSGVPFVVITAEINGRDVVLSSKNGYSLYRYNEYKRWLLSF